jgi:general secretion pathway protein F
MPVFEYTAFNAKGKRISGIIDSESALSVRQKLRLTEIYPTSVVEIHETPTRQSRSSISIARIFNRIRPGEIYMMTRELATLLGAGFPLVGAMETMISQARSPAIKRILARTKDAVLEGESFADALATSPDVFSPLYVNMIRAGETSGTLEIVLERLADIAEKQQSLIGRIKSAVTYPIFMAFIGVLVLFFLITFIVPSISAIFADMGQILPAPTRFLIQLSRMFQSFWWIGFLVFAAAVIAFQHIKKTEQGQFIFDQWILKIPAVGDIVKKLSVARFARTLGSLLENGISMMIALDIVKNIAGNVVISKAVATATDEVEKGIGLGNALASENVFPNLSIQMIQVGEQSGKLEAMLEKVADIFEKEAEARVMRMTSLLEPVMILIMGVAVGFIVLSICLPIFEMNQLVM